MFDWEKLKRVVEAVLFALGEPLSEEKLADALGVFPHQVTEACHSLEADYQSREAGIRLICLDGSWQLVSEPQWGEASRRVWSRKRPDKLSQAALETLAVVAYFQPVTRVYVDQVRGVDCSHSLSLLFARELVEPCGNLDVPGRPILYRTTQAFLRSFGLRSLDDLPPLPDGMEEKEAEV
mgnify:CR=1 FL=1